MSSIACPKCGKRIGMFELVCFSCGYAITEEERERQLKELEKQLSDDSLKSISPQERVLKHLKKLRILQRLNRMSVGLFKMGWGEIVVPSIIIVLIVIVIVLMII
jgi:tRNA(Ile2) C34 agmatinyltransferase TiaS